MPTVICQKWLESECGWGTRPDGYSLHLSEAHCQRFVERVLADQHKRLGPDAPDTYARPDGAAYECPVTDEIHALVAEHGDGVWEWWLRKRGLVDTDAAPWPGGSDGWQTANPPRLDQRTTS